MPIVRFSLVTNENLENDGKEKKLLVIATA